DDDPGSLGGNFVASLYEDRQGVLWVGTLGGGVSKLDRAVDKFPYYAREPGDPNSLSTNQILTLYEDREGTLWIGTWGGGLNRLDRTTNTFTHYKHDPNDPNSPLGNEIMAIHEDREGFLWLGSLNGLDRFDPSTERFTHYLNDPYEAREVTTIYEDREGMLWLGTWMNGVNRYDRATNTFTRFTHNPDDPTSLSDNRVGAIFEDEEGALWLATRDGMLNRFDPAMETFSAHAPMGGQLMIRSFARSEAMPGKYWLGTIFQGLHLYDFETNTSEAFTEKDGLPHDTVLGLLEDDEGYVWVGTARGLSKFDPRTKTFRTYDLTDRLQDNKLMSMPVHKGRSGALYFGGSMGFIAFHPERVTDNPYVPPVVLTDFQLFTESVSVGEESPLKAHVSVAEEIRLAYWQNDISFTFAALNYQAPEQNRYAFQLENYKDDEWRYAGAGRTATYTNLAPGEYIFRAIGSNNDDLWNNEGASIRLVITPPWWKTLWAYALFLVLGATSLFGLIRWRVRYLERRADKLEAMVSARTAEVVQQKATIEAQAQKLQELDRLKSRFFANISHEFRTPLLLILGPLQDTLDGFYGSVGAALRRQIEMMQRSGFRLLRLINQLLDLSKLESGNMQLQARRANLMPFLKGIVLSFSSMAERKQITFELHTEAERLDLYFDPDKLEKVFYNLLSNAFKFTPEHGAISVHVGVVAGKDQVEIRVCDTGRGIPKKDLPYIFDRFHQVDGSNTREHEGTGIGLALVKELILLHHGTITAESEPGVGTVFILVLPKGKAHLRQDQIVTAVEAAASSDLHGSLAELASADLNFIHSDDRNDFVASVASVPDDAPLVLVVEDNKDVREYIGGILGLQYRIALAVDGQDGLEQARALHPDLILSDVMMPKIDGNELCRRLKADEVLKHIPVILLTGRATHESKMAGLEVGADDFMAKPFNARELFVRVRNLLTLRKYGKQLRLLNENLEQRVQEQLDLILAERQKYEHELVEARDRAEASSRLKSGILDNINHEFRTPLAMILGNAQILIDEAPEALHEFATAIDEGGQRLMKTLKAVIDLSNIEAMEVERGAKPLDLVQETRRGVDPFR
ncbi:MAG: response regulator, partial [Bacteroidetes bacterium]|nr:response regulator [Bacteroidota bacterium]